MGDVCIGNIKKFNKKHARVWVGRSLLRVALQSDMALQWVYLILKQPVQYLQLSI